MLTIDFSQYCPQILFFLFSRDLKPIHFNRLQFQIRKNRPLLMYFVSFEPHASTSNNSGFIAKYYFVVCAKYKQLWEFPL